MIKLTEISTFDFTKVLGYTLVNPSLITKIVRDCRRDTQIFSMIYFNNCEPVLVKETINEIETILQGSKN